MAEANLETTDIFRGAFYLCMGGDLSAIRFKANGKQIAVFHFSGTDLHRHDKAYINGHALVNPAQFREALNHLRDILFCHLREHDPATRKRYAATRGRTRNDHSKGDHRAGQTH